MLVVCARETAALAALLMIAASCRKVEPKRDASIDGLFQAWVDKLPEPTDESQSNGFALRCQHHGQPTFGLLAATAAKLPVNNDEDVARLVPWMRHEDACIRQIAIDAALPRIPYDRNRLTSHTSDRASWEYHEVLVSLKTSLDAKHVAYPPALFDGLGLSIREQDFAPMLAGTWAEDAKEKNLFHLITIEPDTLRITTKQTAPDPQRPDRTFVATIDRVRVNERLQFVVSTKDDRSNRTYAFWPSSKDRVWFDNGVPNDWVALERARP